LTISTALVALLVAQQKAGRAMLVGKDKVEAAWSKGGGVVINYGDLTATPDFSIAAGRRDKPGMPEWHERDTEVMYIVEGAATIVTGGTLENAKETRPGQKSGSSITGGETHRVTKGDVLAIPAQTPHWFKEVPGPISYYVSRAQK
jgi:mannose-6-phosphate isomerase-like protein (cupin superfamily)